ncbi:PaREP1 family protein [Caldivirga maquilingensis]|uniref:PaREP1 family protein n=1 Tax=Caldivirga maquilingensis TaxID=76887 RepID=UPI00064FBEAC
MEELIKKLTSRGIDVTELLLDALSMQDPEESMRERIAVAEKYLSEAKQYIDKGDAVQASEKAYKAAEEVIKALAEKHRTPEYQEFLREGRWYTYMLGMASKTLTKELGYWVLDGWNTAYDLHVWGFHEGKYTINHVKVSIMKIEEIIKEAKKLF